MIDEPIRHLDANVFADYSRGREPNVKRRFEAMLRTRLAVSVVVVGELLLGAEKTGDPFVLEDIRSRLEDIRRIAVDEQIAIRYAEVRAQLERAGQRMSDNDLWIAATALVHGATLVTADEAFVRVPGLNVENWRV